MDDLTLEKLYGNIKKTSYNVKLLNKEAGWDASRLVLSAEEIYYSQIDTVCKSIFIKQPKIVFVSGPSASGKTTTAQILQQKLSAEYNVSSILVSLDDFFLNAEDSPVLADGSPDLENFTKLDVAYFNKFFNDIITRGWAMMPSFDFVLGARKNEETKVELTAGQIVIIEGTHALNPALVHNKEFLDRVFKVYVCTNSEFVDENNIVISNTSLRKMRRLLRDMLKRGETIDGFLKKWPRVIDGEQEFILPYKTEADFVVDTVHLYEPFLYARYLKPIIEEYIARHNTKEFDAILKGLTNLISLSKRVIPNNSMLWEVFVK